MKQGCETLHISESSSILLCAPLNETATGPRASQKLGNFFCHNDSNREGCCCCPHFRDRKGETQKSVETASRNIW